MSVDTNGVLTALNLASPVLAGHEELVGGVLKALPKQHQSPLARLGTVHFGRWSLICDWPERGQTALWFSADFEGSVERFVAGVRVLMAEEAEAVWSHCVDWPGVEDPAALERWVFSHRIPTHYFLAAMPSATLADCKRAHARRRQLVELAIAAQKMERDEVLAEFRRRFRTLGA